MIRVILPAHLKTLTKVAGEIELELSGPVTQATVLEALEARYPVLLGTIRDPATKKRRPFVRFFACEEDHSHDAIDVELPRAVIEGREPYIVVGAMAGG